VSGFYNRGARDSASRYRLYPLQIASRNARNKYGEDIFEAERVLVQESGEQREQGRDERGWLHVSQHHVEELQVLQGQDEIDGMSVIGIG
jgi:hypothetical protein